MLAVTQSKSVKQKKSICGEACSKRRQVLRVRRRATCDESVDALPEEDPACELPVPDEARREVELERRRRPHHHLHRQQQRLMRHTLQSLATPSEWCTRNNTAWIIKLRSFQRRSVYLDGERERGGEAHGGGDRVDVMAADPAESELGDRVPRRQLVPALGEHGEEDDEAQRDCDKPGEAVQDLEEEDCAGDEEGTHP